MPVADYFDLLPLLLPVERRSLLVVGWHPSLVSRLGSWERIRVLVDGRSQDSVSLPRSAGKLEIVTGAEVDPGTTLLACGLGPHGWNRELPPIRGTEDGTFVALARSGTASIWRRKLPAATWALTGLPILGRPWVWSAENEPGIDWNVFSPRGRVELPWIRLNRALGRTLLRNRRVTLLAGGSLTPLRQILAAAAPGMEGPGRFWNHTKKNTLVVLTRSVPPLIVKVPLEPEGLESMRAHQRCVEAFRASTPKVPLLDLLPRQTRRLPVGEFEGGVEEAFCGVSAYRHLPRKRRLHAIQDQAARLLSEWQQACAEAREQGVEEFELLWESPLRPLGQALEGHELRSVYSVCLERLRRRVVGRVYPVVPTHGDFWINNLMWDAERGEISGILDWDRGRRQGLPLLDLFQLLFQRTHYLYALHSRRSLRETLGNSFPGREGRMIREYAARFELSEEQIEDLFYRYWLGEAAANADTFLAEHEARRALRSLGEWNRR